jgi:hypothetical protein
MSDLDQMPWRHLHGRLSAHLFLLHWSLLRARPLHQWLTAMVMPKLRRFLCEGNRPGVLLDPSLLSERL